MSPRTSRRAVSEIVRDRGGSGRGATSTSDRNRCADSQASGVRIVHPVPPATIAMIA